MTTTTPETATVYRLAPEVYEDFAKRFRQLQPNENTTALQAGYALGVEAVLKALRNELVIR